MKIAAFLIFGSILFLTSCSPKLTSSMQTTYASLDYMEEVFVFGIDEQTPPDAEVLGTIKVGDTGFSTNCDYATALDKAKTESRKVGGNALKITKHSLPDIWSSCHRITVDVLKVEDTEKYLLNAKMADVDSTLIDENYAIINVYRPGGSGALIKYNLHLGDSIICRVNSNFCESIKIDKEGLNSLWAKTETKSEIPINVELGKVYYLRCSISMGAFVGRPKLELVDNKTGKIEFNSIQDKKEKKNKKNNKK
jgi:hypothetical protein